MEDVLLIFKWLLIIKTIKHAIFMSIFENNDKYMLNMLKNINDSQTLLCEALRV